MDPRSFSRFLFCLVRRIGDSGLAGRIVGESGMGGPRFRRKPKLTRGDSGRARGSRRFHGIRKVLLWKKVTFEKKRFSVRLRRPGTSPPNRDSGWFWATYAGEADRTTFTRSVSSLPTEENAVPDRPLTRRVDSPLKVSSSSA